MADECWICGRSAWALRKLNVRCRPLTGELGSAIQHGIFDGTLEMKLEGDFSSEFLCNPCSQKVTKGLKPLAGEGAKAAGGSPAKEEARVRMEKVARGAPPLKNLSRTKFSAMSGAQMLERLRELRGDTNSLRAQIKRLQGHLARVHQQRADELKRSSKGLAKKALGADAELRRVFGKGGNVEHLLDALAKPRKEGGLRDIEKMCMAASAANLRHKRASSRRYPPGVLAFFSAVSKQGGAKSAVKLLRGPGLVGLKLKKGAVASRGDAKYNLACVPTQQAIRNDDDRCSTDPGYLYGISRKTIELALGFGGPRVPKRLGWDETDGRMTFAGYGSSSKRGEYFKKKDMNMPGFDAKAAVLGARYRELLQPIHTTGTGSTRRSGDFSHCATCAANDACCER